MNAKTFTLLFIFAGLFLLPFNVIAQSLDEQSSLEPRIIIANETGDNQIVVRDVDGGFVRDFATSTSGNNINIAAGNFDSDHNEVAVTVNKQVSFYKVEDGTELHSFSPAREGDIAAGEFILDNDSLEFFIASGDAKRDGVSIYGYDGEHLGSIPLASLGDNTKFSITTADIDGDNIVEIIAGDLHHDDQVAIYKADGTEVNTFAAFALDVVNPNTRRGFRKSNKSEEPGNSCSKGKSGHCNKPVKPEPKPAPEPVKPEKPKPAPEPSKPVEPKPEQPKPAPEPSNQKSLSQSQNRLQNPTRNQYLLFMVSKSLPAI